MATVIAPALEQGTSTRNEFGRQLYRKALAVFYIEERMKVFARQGKCSFVASSRGHEITQLGITSLLKPDTTGSLAITGPRELRSEWDYL